jgi:hypothetical protein
MRLWASQMGVDESRMIAQTRRIASWAFGIVRMVREETGHTTARNLSRERKNIFFKIIIYGMLGWNVVIYNCKNGKMKRNKIVGNLLGMINARTFSISL